MKFRTGRLTDQMLNPEQTAEVQNVLDNAVCCAAEEMIEEIDCCLAEVAETRDDETAVAEAFGDLWNRYYSDEIGRAKFKEEAKILKARYAHTEYIQAKRCCGCGSCPWDD